MPKPKDSNKNPAPQDSNVKNIVPEPFTYNVDGLDDFLSLVFHTDLDNDEEICTWIGGFGLPKDEDAFFKRLARMSKPAGLYFGASTMVREPKTSALYNRKTQFKRMHVLVLDDIGTKVPIAKIPKDFQPTYKIESSEGNYQYGYVLETPIDDLSQAGALVQLVYQSGFTDTGGALPNKIIRLPDGINGKEGRRGKFTVKLADDTGPRWTPEAILEKLNIGVDWADVQKDAEAVKRQRARDGLGASAWSPVKTNGMNVKGIIDPVAEWLFEQDYVKQEGGEWLTILCPWADTHSENGGDWASYSPLGHGEGTFANSRNFHCFHDHCRTRHTDDFLLFVANADGPVAARHEAAAHLTSTYVFDSAQNGVWDIKNYQQPTYISIDAFRNLHPGKTRVPTMTPAGVRKMREVSEVGLYLNAPTRVSVYGSNYDPTTVEPLVNDAKGNLEVNLHTCPDWGDGDWDEADISMWENFTTYLIPNDEERKFFLDWLAAKTQDMGFRGPAVLMIAPSQGTGRSTLANMISALFGKENVERVPFERLSQGGGQFNDWIVKPIIVTDETLALDDSASYYRVYERLKELIDTTPQEVRVNPKFGRQRFQTTYSSYLLFSNHEDAMRVAEGDRRIYVLNNAEQPAKPEYFVWLNEWIKAGKWQRSVWRWLRKREVNVGELNMPPARTRAKDNMLRASKQPIHVALETLLTNWPTDLIAFFQAKSVLDSQQFKPRFHLLDDKRLDMYLQRAFRELTLPPAGGEDSKHRINGKVTRVKFIKSRGKSYFHADQITHELSEQQDADLRTAISEALDEHDF